MVYCQSLYLCHQNTFKLNVFQSVSHASYLSSISISSYSLFDAGIYISNGSPFSCNIIKEKLKFAPFTMEEEKEMSRNGSHGRGSGHIITPTATQLTYSGPTPSSFVEDQIIPCKKVVRYKECLKNHAAALGGNATDGCGEFMPSGEYGTLEALKCSACNCHRNFHKKEIDGESSSILILGNHNSIVGSPQVHHHPVNHLLLSRAMPYQQMMVSYGSGSVPSESAEKDDIDDDGDHKDIAMGVRAVEKPKKKRFRTKFTEEQKHKMLSFAEKVGWKMQKLDDSVVQRFCLEIGIKRRVLKVWMHNNKHHYLQRKSHQIAS